jgi:hypothetical protein
MGRDGANYPVSVSGLGFNQGSVQVPVDDRVSEHDILSGHFQASAGRVKATRGPVLILHDTTTFSYQRERPELIGYTGKTTLRTGKNGTGPRQPLTHCGILMHSSLVVMAKGLPLGLAAVKFWTGKQFKGTSELKRHINAVGPTVAVCVSSFQADQSIGGRWATPCRSRISKIKLRILGATTLLPPLFLQTVTPTVVVSSQIQNLYTAPGNTYVG